MSPQPTLGARVATLAGAIAILLVPSVVVAKKVARDVRDADRLEQTPGWPDERPPTWLPVDPRAARLRPVRRIDVHDHHVSAIAVSPDGRRIVTGAWPGMAPGEVKVWDASTGEEVARFEVDHQPVSVAFVGGSHRVLSTRGKQVTVWDLAPSVVSKSIEVTRGYVESAGPSPDGRFVATVAWHDPAVRLWDLATGEEVRAFEPPAESSWHPSAIGFSPDGDTLVASDADARLRAWRAATGEPVPTGDAAATLVRAAFTAGGTLAVNANDPATRLWIGGGGAAIVVGRKWWNTWALPATAATLGASLGRPLLALFPEASTFATTNYDGFVTVWRLPLRPVRPT